MVPGLALPPSLPAAKMDKKSGFSHAYRSTWGWNGGDGGGERDIDGLQWDLVFVATDTLTCRGRPAAKSAGRCALLVLPATSCPPAPGAPGSRSKCWWRPTSLQKQCGCARQNVGGSSSSSAQHAHHRFCELRVSPLQPAHQSGWRRPLRWCRESKSWPGRWGWRLCRCCCRPGLQAGNGQAFERGGCSGGCACELKRVMADLQP